MTKRRTPELIRGHATHRRTEGDYMGALLDTVSLADRQNVVTGALQNAKGGDAQARNWLAQYLIGRPEGKAPTPLTVVVQQMNGADPVVDRLAKLRERLGWEPGMLNGEGGRPKGMHWKTYELLTAIHNGHVRRAVAGMRAKLCLTLGRIDRISEAVDRMGM